MTKREAAVRERVVKMAVAWAEFYDMAGTAWNHPPKEERQLKNAVAALHRKRGRK